MGKRPRKLKPLQDYLQENPKNDVFDYVEDYGMDAWNLEVAPMIAQKLKDDIWPRGQALIGYKKGTQTVVWHYRDDRYETESINEIFVLGKKKDFLITDVMQLIFTVGDKIFVDGQYGKLTEIYEFDSMPRTKTEIGKVYTIKVSGLDLTKFASIL